MSTVGWREILKEAREASGLSVIDVARKLEVDRVTVHRWESGARTPDVETLQRWGAVVGVDVGIHVSKDPGTAQGRLVDKLRSIVGSIDSSTLRMLQAQLDAIEAGLNERRAS